MTTSKEFNAVGRRFIKNSDLKGSDLRSSTATKPRNAKKPNVTPTGQKEVQSTTTGGTTAASSKVVGKRKLEDDAGIDEPISKKAKTNETSSVASVTPSTKSQPQVQEVQPGTASVTIADVEVACGGLPRKSKSQLQKLAPDIPSVRVPKVDGEGKNNEVDKLKSEASKKLKDKEKSATADLDAIKSIFSQARKTKTSASLKNPTKVLTKRKIDQSGDYEENAPKRFKSKQTLSTIKDTYRKTKLSKTPRIRSGPRRIDAKHVHPSSVSSEEPEDTIQLVSLASPTSEPQNKVFRAELTSKPQASHIQQSFDENLGKTAKQIQNELKREAADLKRREALLKANNPFISRFDGKLGSEKQASPAHASISSGSDVDDEFETRPAQHTQHYRKTFRGLTDQGHGQCANAVTQCLATLPRLAEIYKDKPAESVLAEEELDMDLFGEIPINIEQETGALFRELNTPGEAAIDIFSYHQKLERDGGFDDETRGDQEVDASPYLKEWIERHNTEDKSDNDESTNNTPLESMLKRKMKVTIECSACKERTTQYEDFTTPLQLSIPADATAATLEECIDEYFKKQTLHDQECNWCDGLVEATKSTCFADLPPNLIFSINRTDASGAKIRTPVRVNTGHMDFGRWLDGNQANVSRSYEISSMVEHRGKSVSDGMYIATCRMHGSGKEKTEETGTPHEDTWRVIKDEQMSKRFSSQKIRDEHRDGQLFFLQKVE